MMRAIQNTVNRIDGEQEEEEGLEFEERVPKEYYDITFNFNELFPYRPWNHTIVITPRAPLKNCNISTESGNW